MFKNNIEFVHITSNNAENPTRRILCKFSDVFDFMKANGVQTPKLLRVREWLDPLNHVAYVEQTRHGLREILNPDEKPAVRYCKGKNTAYTTPTGAYLMLSKLSLAENCVHRDFSLRMLVEIYRRCCFHVEELYLPQRTLKYMRNVTHCTMPQLEYRIANARDYFQLPAFGDTLNDKEIAALIVLGHHNEPQKGALLAKAARADVEGFELTEETSTLPTITADLDLSWLD